MNKGLEVPSLSRQEMIKTTKRYKIKAAIE